MHYTDTGAGAFAEAFEDPSTSEHVLLQADEAEIAQPAAAPGRVVRRLELPDRARRCVTALSFHDDGKLRVEHRQRGRPGTPRTIDLTYLDPAPTVERRYAVRIGRVALAAAGVAALAGTLAFFGVLGAVTVTAAGLAAATAAAAAYAFVLCSRETAVFVTRHGRAPALTLTATLGSFGAQRKALPLLAGAIREAGASVGGETHVYLKSEMREHYRLRGEGVLSDADCADGTARVLARFDALA